MGRDPHAARAIAPFIAQHIPKPRLLVFGIMSDKDVTPVTEMLFPLFDTIITTEPYPPRSMKANAFAGTIAIADPNEAFQAAMESDENHVVIAGSLYLAGAAIAFFDKIRRP